MADYVTLREYGTVAEAKDAEQQLALGGISAVTRSGKKLKVDVDYEAQARAMLAGSATPADTAANAASTVSDTAQSAASTATNAAQNAASTVVDAATNVASSAVDTVQDAASAVTEQTNKVTSVAADKVRDLADTVRQQGSSPDAPRMQQQAAQTTAGVLEKTSQYIAPGGVQTLLSDVRTSIQRHPLRSLLIGLSVGYLLRSRFFPAQPATTSTASTTPSLPPPPTLPPVPSYPATSMADVDVPAPTSSALASAPLLDTPIDDAALAVDDYTTTSVVVGDDVLDADMAATDLDTGFDSSLADTSLATDLDTSTMDVNMSTGAADLYADALGTDVTTDMGTTGLRGDMADATLGDTMTDADVLDTDLLMDESVAGVDTAGTTSMDADFGSMDTPSTTPLSTDDLDTTGASDLGDAVDQWNDRTRGEGFGA